METKKLGPGTYSEQDSYTYCRGTHSYNIANNLVFQEMTKQISYHHSPEKYRSTINELYDNKYHELSLSPIINEQKSRIKHNHSPSPIRHSEKISVLRSPQISKQSFTFAPRENKPEQSELIRIISMSGFLNKENKFNRESLPKASILKKMGKYETFKDSNKENLCSNYEEIFKIAEIDEETPKINKMPLMEKWSSKKQLLL